ncbi:hypothetical protein [Flavobacterium sp.]|jgi:hypothetical protein|uniref:hypothetical protein n=1 Tax=Flavobacterium sp. TaxID=239 RepID=UPI0037BE932C
MKLIKLSRFFVLFLSLSFVIQGCTQEDNSTSSPFNYVTFETKVKNISVNPGATLSTDVKVYSSKKSGSARTYNVSVAATSTMLAANYTVPATVTIPANSNEGVLTITARGVGLNLSLAKTIVLNLVAEDGLYAGSALTVNVRENCPLNTVTFDLILDRWGSEISWDIKNASNVIVASGGPYTDTATNALQPVKNFIFCIPNGTYTFTIRDLYGDGMVTSATVVGSYVLKANGTTIASLPGNFTTSRSHTFTL